MGDKSKGLGFGGVILGLILIIASFFLIYNAALRNQTSDVLGKPVPVAKAKDGQPFYATGTILPRKIGDKDYLKEKGPFITLKREVHVYTNYGVKREKVKKIKKKDKKGKKKTKKKKVVSYKCKTSWVLKPRKDKSFDKSCGKEGKAFGAKTISDKKEKKALLTIKDAASGKQFSVAEGSLVVDDSAKSPITKDHLKKNLKEEANILKKGDSPIIKSLSASKVRGKKANLTVTGAAVFDAATCDAANLKKIGCQRIVFSGVAINPKETYTVIGGSLKDDPKLGRKQIGPLMKGETGFLKLCKGTHTTCLQQLGKADSKDTKLWLVGAIAAFFFGMVFFTAPLTNLIEKIPLVGGLGKFALYFIYLVMAFSIMLPLFVALKYWYLVLGGIVLLVVLLFVLKKK